MPTEIVKEDTLEDLLSPTKYEERKPKLPTHRIAKRYEDKVAVTQPDPPAQ